MPAVPLFSAIPSPAATGPSPRLVLSSLWATVVLVFAYVDLLGCWRADVLRAALAGTVPSVGFTIDQRFLTLTTLHVLVLGLMVAGTSCAALWRWAPVHFRPATASSEAGLL